MLDATDRRLIALLRDDARLTVSSLADALSLSRSSIHARMARLKRDGVIRGFTVELGSAFEQRLIRAHMMLKVLPKQAKAVERALCGFAEVTELHSISGENDLIAIIEAEGTSALNDLIDRIGALDGVEKTTSSILLATRLKRRS